jgi:pSer/pThr/pTyr-binding forkhead associated (FHA) protein
LAAGQRIISGRTESGRANVNDQRDQFDEVNQPDEAFALDAFKRECKLSLDAFCNLHGRAFLLLQRSANKSRLQVPERPSRTLVTRAPSNSQELPPSRYLVFPVRKTERSLIARFYAVGQTRNNDIVIRDVSISKFHAFFLDANDGGFLLQDARSTNGTFVNGVRVPRQGQGEPIALAPGDQIRFGTVELSFVDAEMFRELVARVFELS